jgi:mRNA interferase HigB
MHVISKKPFNDAAKKYPNDAKALMDTFSVLEKNTFKTPEELKAVFPSLDNFKYKEKWYVIDIGGNNLRLMAAIQFVHGRMYIKHIVSHSDYDKLIKNYS